MSGSKVYKVSASQFTVKYCKLGNVPLIEQCPINLECQVVHTLALDRHELIVGRIEETHIDESCLANGKPDVTKIKPFIFIGSSRQYCASGDVIARAFNVGQELDKTR